MHKLSRFSAYLGGLVLCFIAVLTCVSVAGRALNGILNDAFMQNNFPALAKALIALGVGPVRGDYEFTEAGIAFAIFAFLPLCQLHIAHASVDVFEKMLPERFARFMAWLTEMVFAITLIVIAWQLTNGLLEKFANKETTFHLEYPLWWSYAGALWGAIISMLVGVYVALLRSREYFLGVPMNLPTGDTL